MGSPGADQLKALLLGLWYGMIISATVALLELGQMDLL